MHTKARIIVVICLCLALVLVTAIARVDRNSTANNSEIYISDTSSESASMDPAFLDDAIQDKPTIAASKPKNTASSISAKAYLVGDLQSGKVYLEKNSSKVLPVASMSKLVTAFVATDLMTLSKKITIASSTLLAPPDTSNLQEGESYTLREILDPLLLSSSNVAAEAISISMNDRQKFMEMMSSYAWEIGMPSSYFADPSGVSPLNAASARDLFQLAKYLIGYRPDILEITRTPQMEIASTTTHGSHTVVSTHPFVTDPRFIGGKTGRTTEAGETMMTMLQIGERQIVFIVLGCDFGAREHDTRLLISEYQKKFAN